MLKKLNIKFRRIGASHDTYLIEIYDNKKVIWCFHGSHEQAIIRVKEHVLTMIDNSEITLEMPKKTAFLCANCEVRVNHGLGFHFCRKSGLHNQSNQKCNVTHNLTEELYYRPREIFTKEFWHNLGINKIT